MKGLMKNLYFRIFLGGLLFSPFFSYDSYGEIFKVSNMINVQKILEKALERNVPSDVLVAFDVDLTLTFPTEKAAQMPNILQHKKIYKNIMENLTSQHQYVMLNLLAEASKHQLIEEKEISFILNNLQTKGVKTIAFSACLTGPLANISRMEIWRYTTLKNLNLDFNKSFEHQTEIVFTEIPAFLNRHPVFYKGVLCASNPIGKATKGPVLNAFLNAMALSPKLIIMIDDTREHLDDIEASLKIRDPTIKFIGIEYTKGRELSYGPISEEQFIAFWKNLETQAEQVIASHISLTPHPIK